MRGEGRYVTQRLQEGAREIQKVISFQRIPGCGVVHVTASWHTEKERLLEQENQQAMQATQAFDWP